MRLIQTADLTPESVLSPDDASWIYNGLDCALTAEIYEALAPQIDEGCRETYELSKALQAPVLEMNMHGLLVDMHALAELKTSMRQQIAVLESGLDEILREGYGVELNWRSPSQLQDFLYRYLRLPVKKKRNANGGFSPTSDRGTLEELQFYVTARPAISYILALRDLAKSLSFLDTEMDADGYMRCNFNIAGTNTGRLSSSYSDFGSGTNLQNVGRALRRIFVAAPGKKLANLDLEQADSRNVGATCWNRFVETEGEAFAGSYLDACESGDLHTVVTKMARPELEWGDDPKGWRAVADQLFYRDKTYRDISKALGHGCLTADHEVLTPNGWVSIAEMPPVIMTWTPQTSKFESVSRWTAYIADETVELTGTAYSLRATLNHRLPRNHNYKTSEIKVRDLPLKSGRIPLGGNYVGGNVVVPARLVAAIMSDGELIGNKTRFHFHKERKKTRLRQLAAMYNIALIEHKDGRISVDYNCVKQLGAYALQWTSQCIKDFVDEYKWWDGHQSATAVSLHSTSLIQLEWLQTLGRLVGLGGNIQKPQTSGFGSTVWTLQQNNRGYADISRLIVTPKDGAEVFCPTVNSTWFYVRRSGKISVTGNSNYLLTPESAVKKTHIAVQAAREFQARYFTAFPCIPAWHQAVADDLLQYSCLTTIFNFRRFFFGRPDDPRTHRAAVAFEGQSPTASEINRGLLRLWRGGRRFPGFQLLCQVHDSVLFWYDEECEAEIIPFALEALRVPLILRKGREFAVPTEAKVGWNWGDASKDNPDGLAKYKGSDSRKRQIPYRSRFSFL